MVRDISGKKIIYDHQKAGTDITESTPGKFMDVMAEAGVDGVILFPQAGPATEYEWIKAGQERSLGIIVGGEMTHPRYLEGDFSNESYTKIFNKLGLPDQHGFIREVAPVCMYMIAARMGVEDFVVPGNKPEQIARYRDLVLGCGIDHPSFYSPGLVAQGGNLSDGARSAGKSFHAIVGRGIYQAEDMEKAALELGSKL